MTSAAAVLESLAERGIHVELEDGHSLVLRPTALVNADVIGIVRDAKPAIVRHLQLREVDADRPDAEGYLLRRLRSGQAWLDDVLTELETMPYGGLGTTLNTRFIHGLDMWLRLEGTLRYALHVSGCIRSAFSETCPQGTTATCSACVEVTA